MNFYVAPKLNTREECAKVKCVPFGEEVTGTKVANPKTVLGFSLDEKVYVRDNFSLILKNMCTSD
jgi:hypothetical protein